MKKLLAITTLSLISSLASADRAIILHSGEPLPMGSKAETTYNKSTTSGVGFNGQMSLAGGYAGSKIGSSEFGGDERFNGFFLNAGTYIAPKTSLYMEYAFQDASEMDFHEISAGLQYKVLENQNNYAAVGAGIGYAWLDESAYDTDFDANVSIDLTYVTLPIHFELGHKVNNNLDVFGNVGYKWLINEDAEACVAGQCISSNSSDLNVDGVTYKAGIRYNF